MNLKLYVHPLGDPPFFRTRKNGPRQRRQCSGVNTEPNKPNPVQAWAVAVNPIAEPSMEQVGGRTCKTLRRSSINVPVVVMVGNARTDVSEECMGARLLFRWEGEIVPHLFRGGHVGSGPSYWIGSPRLAEKLGLAFCPLWARLC
ncbi:hypothetical protein PIB30_001345 [Stylosanthes scabra]|uniref:Uncharacterized protein n=1 Tax=Stylosanthes scabra TaxID=79078 RepID=A0ABU6Y0Z9_9FABA|nr:hypothetical protein [Stylosanthes scabra]